MSFTYEARPDRLDDAYEKQFQEHPQAWAFFQAQAPYYQRGAIWWVLNAKREETRQKRLATLIELSSQGKKLPMYDRSGEGG